MTKIAILVAFILPVFLREKFLKIFAVSLGKGFDFGSTEKEFSLIKPHLNHNPKVLIDVGVNRGNYSDVLINNFPNATLYLFEPQTYLYDILSKKYSSLNNVNLFNLALDENKGEVTLVKGFEGDGEASIYNRKYLNNKKELKETVKCNRLDNIIINQKIDFIKIDVEGNEMRVLNGMKKVTDHWIVKSLDCKNRQDRSNTRFEVTSAALNLDLELSLFSPGGLLKTPVIAPDAFISTK